MSSNNTGVDITALPHPARDDFHPYCVRLTAIGDVDYCIAATC